MRMKIACRLAGGIRWNALVCSSVVIQSLVVIVAAELRLQLADFVVAGLVPGDHDVEQIGVDGDIVDIFDARAVILRGTL
jgi:hypothetical protein